jgi:hypothetical protein
MTKNSDTTKTKRTTKSTTKTTPKATELKDQLKKYYVYALIDPRLASEKGIFYIGKGTDKRGLAHAANALKLSNLEKTDEDKDKDSEKNKKIREIYAATQEKPMVRVLGRFDTHEEAFAAESILIKYSYGLTRTGGPLTNIVLGHKSRHIRDKGNFDSIERLDIPKVNKIDGTYIRSELDKLLSRGIPEIAEETVDQIRALIAKDPDLRGHITIEAPKIVEYGRYVGAIVNFGEEDVILRLQFRPTSLITNLRARHESTKLGKEKFSARMSAHDLEIKGHGSYGWIEGWKNNGLKFNDYEIALSRIKQAYNCFKG